MSQFERCFTLKRSICTQPGGQMTHNNGIRLCAPRQLVVWVSSQGPPLVRSHARLHTAAQAASPTAVVSLLLLSISATASCPWPCLPTSFLLLPGRRRPIYRKDALSINPGELILQMTTEICFPTEDTLGFLLKIFFSLSFLCMFICLCLCEF